MRKKFKTLINLFALVFVIFYPIKSNAASVQCDLFVKTLLNNPDRGYESQKGDVVINDFGFALQYDWDSKKNKTYYRKDKSGNFIVGKVHSLSLGKELKSGNSIIKINDKKFTNSEEQKELLLKSNKAKVEFFDKEKGNFILELERKEKYVHDVLINIEDISINSINQKQAVYEARFKYDFSKIYSKGAYENLYNIADGTIIFDDNGAWNIDVCIFTEEEFKNSRILDPGFQMDLLNITSKDNDLFNVHYKITPYAKKYSPDNIDALYIQKKIEGIFGFRNYADYASDGDLSNFYVFQYEGGIECVYYNESADISGEFVTNQRYHVAIVYDGSTISSYLNGTLMNLHVITLILVNLFNQPM